MRHWDRRGSSASAPPWTRRELTLYRRTMGLVTEILNHCAEIEEGEVLIMVGELSQVYVLRTKMKKTVAAER